MTGSTGITQRLAELPHPLRIPEPIRQALQEPMPRNEGRIPVRALFWPSLLCRIAGHAPAIMRRVSRATGAGPGSSSRRPRRLRDMASILQEVSQRGRHSILSTRRRPSTPSSKPHHAGGRVHGCLRLHRRFRPRRLARHLYVTNSAEGAKNHLYRNMHDGTFQDVAAQTGRWPTSISPAPASPWEQFGATTTTTATKTCFSTSGVKPELFHNDRGKRFHPC